MPGFRAERELIDEMATPERLPAGAAALALAPMTPNLVVLGAVQRVAGRH